MVFNKDHQKIILLIKKIAQSPFPNKNGFGLKYVGTNKPSYHLDTKSTRTIAKNFLKENQLNYSQIDNLLNSLYAGKTYDEMNLASKIIEFSPEYRRQLNPQYLDQWLNRLHGWAEVDTLCQMAFTSDDILNNWPVWHKLLLQFSQDINIHKRRASLVLLTKPVRQSDDHRLVKTAFVIISRLKMEKHILITKAVSWLLRSLIKNNPEKVSSYITKNKESLPKIAVREVISKLKTGKKYINQSKSVSRQ